MQDEREFPRLPTWLWQRLGAGAPARLRRFGSQSCDLEIEFEHAECPVLVSKLLTLCSTTSTGAPVQEDMMLDLPVGLQLEAVLALADLSDALPFAWHFRCSAPECLCESEFELRAEELSALVDYARDEETTELALGQHRLTLRRPTGRDQRECLVEAGAIGAKTMLARILVSPPLEELEMKIAYSEIEHAVDEAMSELDPLPGFKMQVVCPECHLTSTATPPLTTAALQRLMEAQEFLLDDVHRIASHYHWSETEILNMPGWRRQGYLQRIEQPEYAR